MNVFNTMYCHEFNFKWCLSLTFSYWVIEWIIVKTIFEFVCRSKINWINCYLLICMIWIIIMPIISIKHPMWLNKPIISFQCVFIINYIKYILFYKIFTIQSYLQFKYITIFPSRFYCREWKSVDFVFCLFSFFF